MPKIFNLSELTSNQFRNIIGDESVVLLAGSGISGWFPTNLPSGKDFSQGVFHTLFDSADLPSIDQASLQWLSKWNDNENTIIPAMPFEVIMERCPKPEALRPLIANLYKNDSANPMHDAIAQLAKSNKIESIITSNYDCCLDSALINAGWDGNTVVRQNDVQNSSNDVYFKIHGTAKSGGEDTLIYRLRAEGTLPAWKRSLLKRLVQGKTVLIIGYSGIDFDICPEVMLCKPKRIVWNFFSQKGASNSPGLKRLGDAGIDCTVLLGDMQILPRLFGIQSNANRPETQFDVAGMLSSEFSVAERLLWRAKILNSLGFAKLAIETLNGIEHDRIDSYSLLLERGQAEFHHGQYLTSANLFLQASECAHDDEQRALCMLSAADALRCYGTLREARKLIDTAVALGDRIGSETVKHVANLKSLLILRHKYQAAKLLRIPVYEYYLHSKAIPLLKPTLAHMIEQGNWFDFQQLYFWAERMQIPKDQIKPENHYLPLPTQDGYKHLGFPIAVAMQACDLANSRKVSATELDELLEQLLGFACHPQIWKLVVAMGKVEKRSVLKNWGLFAREFFACQYTMLQRVRMIVSR